MKNNKFKIIAAVAALVLALAGCGAPATTGSSASESTTPESSTTTASSSLAESSAESEPATLERIEYTWMVSEHPNFPVRDDWEIIKVLEEKTGVAIKFQAIPEANYFEKRKLVIAGGDIPDLMASKLNEANDYGPQGAYLPVNEHLTGYENITVALPEQTLNSLKAIDGNIYALPNISDGETVLAWLVREDVLEELSLAHPTNLDEFHAMLVAMKAANPESYPFTMRYNLALSVANTWGIGNSIYFDAAAQEFKYGPFQPEYKEMVSFFGKLYAENLMDPEYAVAASKQWEEKMSSGMSYVTVDNFTRSDNFTNLMKTENPDYNLKMMLPPVTKETSKPTVTAANKQYTYTSFGATIAQPERLMGFLDYLYSPDGQMLFNWGIEGVTYTMENGVAVPTDKLENPRTGTGEINLWRDLGAASFLPTVERSSETGPVYKFGNNTIEGVALYKDGVEYMQPSPNLAFTSEELDIMNPIRSDVDDYVNSNFDKFIMNSFTEETYAEFLATITGYGMERVVEIYNQAYARQYQ